MRYFILVTSFVFTIAFSVIIYSEGISFYAIGGIVLFGGGFLMQVFNKQIDKRISDVQKKKHEASFCKIIDNDIHFPNGYYFKHGYLKNKNRLNHSEIDEIRTNTFPTTALINGNEIVFLITNNKKELMTYAKNNNIKINEPIDNWSLICEEFLDTEFDGDWKQKTNRQLGKVGITKEELSKIRKKISARMLLWTAVSWEWMYYGQFDVLEQIGYLNDKKYWWTMEIALRNKNEL